MLRCSFSLALATVSALGLLFLAHFCLSTWQAISPSGLLNWNLLRDEEGSLDASSAWDGVPYDTYDGLLWFVQVSDLHLNTFRAPDRIRDLEPFCDFLSVIAPHVVLATGDLTDGKASDGVTATQIEEDWIEYEKAVKRCRQRVEGLVWLDLRGNHDTFDVGSDDSQLNFFRRYGAQGGKRRSYFRVVAANERTFGFVGIDATLSPGPKTPFNFFGALNGHHLTEVGEILELAKRESSGGLVAFGHYPLSFVSSPSPGIKRLVGEARPNAYVSGHLHDIYGWAPRLYARQPEGYLELELSDWKDGRSFRVGALDRGQLSFADGKFERGAVASVLIINPLDIRFHPGDGLKAMRESTHLRVLVFAREVETIVAEIDGVKRLDLAWTNIKQRDRISPLYVAPWNPAEVSTGRHNLTLTVRAKGSPPLTSSRVFTLDQQVLESGDDDQAFTLLERFMLLTDIHRLLGIVFYAYLAVVLMPMLLLRTASYAAVERCLRPLPKVLKPLACHVLKACWLTSNLNAVALPIMAYLACAAFGPWCCGYLMQDSVGVVFSFGTYLGGAWLPTSTTYFHWLQLMLPFHLLHLVCVAWAVHSRHDDFVRRSHGKWRYVPILALFAYVLSAQVRQGHYFYLSHGWLASTGLYGLLTIAHSSYVFCNAIIVSDEDLVTKGVKLPDKE